MLITDPNESEEEEEEELKELFRKTEKKKNTLEHQTKRKTKRIDILLEHRN